MTLLNKTPRRGVCESVRAAPCGPDRSRACSEYCARKPFLQNLVLLQKEQVINTQTRYGKLYECSIVWTAIMPCNCILMKSIFNEKVIILCSLFRRTALDT